MRNTKALPILLAAFALGCNSIRYSETRPDGTHVTFNNDSLLSNTAAKGLTVNGTTKTTSQGLRITGGATEPNVEAITASADALGTLIGAAAATAGKTALKP